MQYTDEIMYTGEKIKWIRKYLRLTRKEFESEIGIPIRSLERIEKNKNNVSFEIIRAILSKYPEFTNWICLDSESNRTTQLKPTEEAYKLHITPKSLESWEFEIISFKPCDNYYAEFVLGKGTEIEKLTYSKLIGWAICKLKENNQSVITGAFRNANTYPNLILCIEEPSFVKYISENKYKKIKQDGL